MPVNAYLPRILITCFRLLAFACLRLFAIACKCLFAAGSYIMTVGNTTLPSENARTWRISRLSRRISLRREGERAPRRVWPGRTRRYSHDELITSPTFELNVNETIDTLILNEARENDFQITVDDNGPKLVLLGTSGSGGHSICEIRGNYMISNLLQEVSLAKELTLRHVLVSLSSLNGNPIERLSARIGNMFWEYLTRSIKAETLEECCLDPKDRTPEKQKRLYVPYDEKEMYSYFSQKAKEDGTNVDVILLERDISAEYVRDLFYKPGLLALAANREELPNGQVNFRGLRYITPGSRFNEQYGWDSYYIVLGLLEDDNLQLAIEMAENFFFQIQHYGKILNANRTYYLARSQPPFLTDMVLRIAKKIVDEGERIQFLRRGIIASIEEYKKVWTAEPRMDPETGLSRYRPVGIGIPPETEATHFERILLPYLKKYDMTMTSFINAYNYQLVDVPELDKFLLHDRGLRESGHDTTARLEGKCADLATVDLNSLVYKYETDIAFAIQTFFNDRLQMPNGSIESSEAWHSRASRRQKIMNEYLWDQERGMYFDYNTVLRKKSEYESATTFWALWAGVATPAQALVMVQKALPMFCEYGGLVSGTETSLGAVELKEAHRQWDYPVGWAPHQILAWKGLERYGYMKEVRNLVYRWLYVVTKTFSDYNGAVVEKYNVCTKNKFHVVNAEYGNQGLQFRGISAEGFGWTNASFKVGLKYCTSQMLRGLGTLAPPDVIPCCF